MHTLVEVPVGGSNGGTHVPAFLAKLWKIVDDPSTNDLICWSEMGNSFIIKNQAKFARDLLPLYYKHNNMASFVRQLNMYGFHKVVSVEQGGLRVDKDEMEFAHPFFLKGQEASLELIKRKIPASKHEESRVRPDSLNKVLMDVRQMKGRQETMDNKLVTMKRENEALWRELASLRQKHAKQTQIVSKLLQFLVGMMSQQTPRLAFKRRMPLMLNDKEGVKQKLSRNDASEPSGPVIHDVTELLESDNSVEDNSDQECLISSVGAHSPLSVTSQSPSYPHDATVQSPGSPDLLFSVDPGTVNPAVSVPTVAALAQLQQSSQLNLTNKTAKPKAKPAGRKNVAPSATITSVKTEVNTAPYTHLPSVSVPQNNLQQQLLQIPQNLNPQNAMNNSNNNNSMNVPTTLYFSAPGMSEPVQVVLSIPDQGAVTIPTTSGMSTISTPIILPSTSAPMTSGGKTLNIPQQQQQLQQHSPLQQHHLSPAPSPLTKSPSPAPAPGPMMNREPSPALGRNQTVNPKFFLKASNGLNATNGSMAPQDLDGHLDGIEVGLNNLKDLFRGQDYQSHMDTDTLIGLFDGHSPEGMDNTENQANQINQQFQLGGATGGEVGTARQEVMAYNPSLFELAEDDTTFFDESSNMFLDDELESMLTTDRDALKRSEGQSRGGVGHVGQLSFSGINLHNSLDSGLNTPVGEPTPSPLTLPPTALIGAGKRKRK